MKRSTGKSLHQVTDTDKVCSPVAALWINQGPNTLNYNTVLSPCIKIQHFLSAKHWNTFFSSRNVKKRHFLDWNWILRYLQKKGIFALEADSAFYSTLVNDDMISLGRQCNGQVKTWEQVTSFRIFHPITWFHKIVVIHEYVLEGVKFFPLRFPTTRTPQTFSLLQCHCSGFILVDADSGLKWTFVSGRN